MTSVSAFTKNPRTKCSKKVREGINQALMTAHIRAAMDFTSFRKP